MRYTLFAFLMLVYLLQKAQLPLVYLQNEQALTLGNLSKSATLFVVIENEKNPDDAALIAALKNYWKIGMVEYLSGLEFSERLKAKNLDKEQLYLYNNYARRHAVQTNSLFATMYDGYYLTNDPVMLYKSLKEDYGPAFLYFSADALFDSRRGPIGGFYSLMIKNFNHDILYCQNEENFSLRKNNNKRKNGVYFFKEDSLVGKTLLLVKEQTQRNEKQTGKKKRRKNSVSEKKEDKVTDKYSKSKEPVVVFPEDIAHSVKIEDHKILLYNGGTLYSAKDGSAYSTIRGDSKEGSFTPTMKWAFYIASGVALIWMFAII